MKNRSMLLKHNRRYHTQTPGISCDICYKELANMAELAAHKMTHRNQTCHICGMVIKGTNNNFKYHMKTHDANRNGYVILISLILKGVNDSYQK